MGVLVQQVSGCPKSPDVALCNLLAPSSAVPLLTFICRVKFRAMHQLSAIPLGIIRLDALASTPE